MTERQKIEATLRKKEAEIQGLEEKLKAAKVYVKALQDVLGMLDRVDEGDSADVTLRPGSTVARAREAILERAKPLHIGDLLNALGKKHTREARASLASSLSAYVRRGEIFSRTAPNTFGLIELGHNDEEPVAEPPLGFGRLSPPAAPPPPESEADYDEPLPHDDDDNEIIF